MQNPNSTVAPASAPILVVVWTTVIGFNKSTFTPGIQYAYRRTVAAHANTTVDRVSIGDIADELERRHRRRLLSSSRGVHFSTSIAMADAATASITKAALEGTTSTAMHDEFVEQISAVAVAGTYDDVPVTFMPPQSLLVTEGEPVIITVAAAAPTPVAPPLGLAREISGSQPAGGCSRGKRGGCNGSRLVAYIMGGVAAVVVVIAIAATRRSRASGLAEAATTTREGSAFGTFASARGASELGIGSSGQTVENPLAAAGPAAHLTLSVKLHESSVI
jgi:hypothetical protein